MKKIVALLVLVRVAEALFAQTAGGTWYVNVKTAEIRANPNSFAEIKGNIAFGEPVTVIQTRNKWVEVSGQANTSLKGWISLDALSSRRVVSRTRTANAEEVAMAGKGFSNSVEQIYKSTSHADYTAVDVIERSVLSERSLSAFLNEGRLTRGE
jgi:uncharacterized protein YgiM (DUF1202 family)